MLPRRPLAALLLAALATTGCTSQDAPQDPRSAAPSASVAVGAVSPSPSETLLTEPPPGTSEVGALAPGFPTDLVTVPDGSEILVSTAERDDATGLLTIGLNLRSPLPTADLVAAVAAGLTAAGFTQSPADAGGLAAAATFVRGTDGAELLTLGVLDRDGVRTLTLGGTVRT